jgi:hypothetical protein
MYVLAPNQQVKTYPYSVNQLRKDNPQVSFPASPSAEMLASYDVFFVVSASPVYDEATQVATENGCVFTGSQWQTAWTVRDKTAEELQAEAEAQAARIEAQRSEAYRNESDPIFFKYQRNEATKEEWLDKIAEIKARYPD